MAEIKITKDNFESEVLDSQVPVLVDFFAVWCGPCRMIAPIIEEIAEEYDGELKVGKINVDEEPELAAKYSVMSIPTVMIFKNGEVVSQKIGYAAKDEIIGMFEQNV